MAEELKLVCKECGYLNEPERIYCHNCGSKLDRSLLPSKGGKERKAGKVKAKGVIRQQVNVVKPLLLSIGLGIPAAILLLAALKPAYLDRLSTETLLEVPTVDFDIQQLASGNYDRPLAYNRQQVNAHLKSSIKTKSSGLLSDYIRFEKAFVILEDGSAGVCMEQSAFGYPFYVRADYAPVKAGEVLRAKCIGGSFGRLDVPGEVMQFLDIALAQLFNALDKDIENLSRCGDIALSRDTVVIFPPGASAPETPSN